MRALQKSRTHVIWSYRRCLTHQQNGFALLTTAYGIRGPGFSS
jgi:hypothetical protein